MLGLGVRSKLSEVAILIPLLIGLALNNGRAVVEALLGQRSPFIRTPKQGSADAAREGLGLAAYRAARSWLSAGVEMMLGTAYIGCCVWLVTQHFWLSLPFALLFAASFLSIGMSSVRARLPHARRIAEA